MPATRAPVMTGEHQFARSAAAPTCRTGSGQTSPAGMAAAPAALHGTRTRCARSDAQAARRTRSRPDKSRQHGSSTGGAPRDVNTVRPFRRPSGSPNAIPAGQVPQAWQQHRRHSTGREHSAPVQTPKRPAERDSRGHAVLVELQHGHALPLNCQCPCSDTGCARETPHQQLQPYRDHAGQLQHFALPLWVWLVESQFRITSLRFTKSRSRPQDGAGISRPFPSYPFHRRPGQ
jgi:hypothetical protein